MKRAIFVLPVIALLILACGGLASATPTATQSVNIATVVAATMQALTSATPIPTQAPPTQVIPTPTIAGQATSTQAVQNGISISYQNVSFIIPNGLAINATGETAAKTDGSNSAPWDIAPAHTKFSFSGYPLSNTFFSPEVLVYPTDEYAQTGDNIAAQIDALRGILNNPNASLPQNLPFLPAINAGQVFYAQTSYVNFTGGMGIRYITQFDQAPLAINNQEIFYTLQGLSSDGKYYIVVTMPINAPFLAADNNPASVTPPDGIALDYGNYNAFPQYAISMTQKINTTAPEVFTPSITLLDALVKSITITQ